MGTHVPNRQREMDTDEDNISDIHEQQDVQVLGLSFGC